MIVFPKKNCSLHNFYDFLPQANLQHLSLNIIIVSWLKKDKNIDFPQNKKSALKKQIVLSSTVIKIPYFFSIFVLNFPSKNSNFNLEVEM